MLVTVTDPEGKSGQLRAPYVDVALSIDPDTGLQVTGRAVTVALSIDALRAKGLGVPGNSPGKGGRPWVVSVVDRFGRLQQFKVIEGSYDRTLARVDCNLEIYRDAATIGPTF